MQTANGTPLAGVVHSVLQPMRGEGPAAMAELFAICRTSEIADSQAAGFVLSLKDESGTPKPWPILVTNKGNRYYGFENACPHHGLRLDAIPGQFLDQDGNFITCGQHRAQFDLDTGHCFIGPCQGQHLKPIELVIDDGDVCVTGVELAEEDGMDLPENDSMPEITIQPD